MTRDLLVEAILRVHVPHQGADEDSDAYLLRVASESGKVRNILRTAFAIMSQSLVSGQAVMLPRVGCLRAAIRRGQRYRHPGHGRMLQRRDARTVTFRLSHVLREALRSAPVPHADREE